MTELIGAGIPGARSPGTGAWAERLQPASFRNVPFHVDSAAGTFGRRAVIHQFPGRDEPAAEDLGRRAREFTIECFVLGADYMAQRDALIAAAEEAGPGDLIHPYLGRVRVQVSVARVRESTREGGMAAISLTCTEVGAFAFPSVRRDTAATVQRAAGDADAAAKEDFVSRFQAVGRSVARAQAALEGALAGVEAQVAGVTGTAAALIRAPAELALAVAGSVTRLRTLATEPLRALGLYRGLFGAGAEPGGPTGTATQQQAARNQAALNALVRRTAVTEACRLSAEASGAEHGSSADALALRAELVEALDGLLAATEEAAADTALLNLRTAVVDDLGTRAAELPRVVRFTPPGTLPALALAHRLYGDATRADEIVARNRIAHPGFVPGGAELELLHDAS